MTGVDALRNGAGHVFAGRTFIRRGIPTMAEIFAANGYRTGLFGKWHLGENYPHRPQDRGFQESIWFPSAAITCASDHWNNDYFDDCYRHNGSLEQYHGYCTDAWFEAAMAWMRQCQADAQPFLAYLTTNADHMPFFVPDRYRDPYRALGVYVASFFGIVANFDENMGRLDAMLRETGLYDNTIVTFMSDNGGVVGADLYNAGMRGSKGSLYEGGHRVPFFLRWPGGGLRSPGDCGEAVQIQDLLPTLLDLCALPAPKEASFDGVSLAPLLRDERAMLPDRMMVVQFGEPSQKWNSAVLWNKWRLIEGQELYDLTTDPAQNHDVAARYPEVVSRMREHYERWYAGLGPERENLETIHVGTDHENPVRLSHLDWRDDAILWYQGQVRSMVNYDGQVACLNGKWHLTVAASGEYEIALRRYPEEADAPLTGSVPEMIPTDTAFLEAARPEAGSWVWVWIAGSFPEGRPLPIARARLKIGDLDLDQPVGPEDKAALFRVHLEAGRTTLQTWFYDDNGQELGGAFYVSVGRA
jgi:arylsulfatase